ncbi:hypothetical protein [Microbacterium sp. MYb64]|uniref:hypothetical protein n=1 Tax=Microbacterium sp. MYb64 TaxID=1848691 RepID=UPI000CFBFF36|nr:hypothetical protein [Microbacterium sp. MYb64]PRB01766.1 hypothetical protein CQ044_16590 [Microbacterium sp. MYb64]
MTEYLTYREAGALVKRSPRTIRYWKSQGMATELVERDGQMVRVVEKKVLQAWFRDRLMNWPTHRWRLRKNLAEEIMRHAEEVRG